MKKATTKIFVWNFGEGTYRLQVENIDGRRIKTLKKTLGAKNWELVGESWGGNGKKYIFSKDFETEQEVKRETKTLEFPVFYETLQLKIRPWNKLAKSLR